MTQRELCLAVAATTGESLRSIRQRGFSLVMPDDVGAEQILDDRPQIVDWDRLEFERIAYAIQA